MKKLLLCLITISLLSCDKQSEITNVDNYLGNYDLKTTTDSNSGFSNMSIFMENGKWFIQTDFFGFPDTVGRYGNVKMYSPGRLIQKGLEPVNTRPNMPCLFKNGSFVYVFLYANLVKSCPIPVQTISNTCMQFQDSPKFECYFVDTDGEGRILDTLECKYVYKTLKNCGDSLTWEVELHYNSITNENRIGKISYKNIAYKRVRL